MKVTGLPQPEGVVGTQNRTALYEKQWDATDYGVNVSFRKMSFMIIQKWYRMGIIITLLKILDPGWSHVYLPNYDRSHDKQTVHVVRV